MDTNAMNNQFSSLHYNLTTSETQFVEEESGDAMAHPACDSCQAQKVKRNALWSKNPSLTTLCHFSFDAMARQQAVSGTRLPPLLAHTIIPAAREGPSRNTMPIDLQGLRKELIVRLKKHLTGCPTIVRKVTMPRDLMSTTQT